MSYPNKMKVNVAVSNHNNFDLSHNTLFSQDFGTLDVVECRYLVPGDKFNYKISKLTRALPMPSPTFGAIKEITRCFFVPVRSIFNGFLDFISNNKRPVTSGYSSQSAPSFTLAALWDCLVDNNALVESENGEYFDSRYQIRYDISNRPFGSYDPSTQSLDSNEYRGTGKDVFRLLFCLGYRIPLNYSTRIANLEFSALPLLACQKFYYDWVVPSRFLGNEWHFSRIQGFINDNRINYDNNDNSLFELLRPLVSFFADDYITGCEQYPYQQNNDYANSFTTDQYFSNPTFPAHPDSNTNGAFAPTDRYLNYFTLQSLGKIQDYLNRGLIAGTKVKDFLKTEFGISPSSDALNISSYLGSYSNVMEIGAITSQSDTLDSGGLALGQYAGKVLGTGDGSFQVSSKEHGFVFITHEIIPETNYYKGLQPHTQMLSLYDFFQPEFDNLGFEAVSAKFIDARLNGSEEDVVFGFQPRYAHLKFSNDIVAGDFDRRETRESLSSWFMCRELNINNPTLSICPAYCLVASPLYTSMDKIFNYTGQDVDHFYNIFRVDCKASRPMASIISAIEPEHPNGSKDVTINKHGAID